MANPMQRAAGRRKGLYIALIVALFTVSIFWRGKLDVPFGNPARAAAAAPTGLNRVADSLARHSVLAQATDLELRELDLGDPEIAGSAIRLSLVGSRGVAITLLWRAAIEKQKRNEFHEFEILVDLVTRLQPNFITPWIFQSWNIAYNVSVENDKLGDMYFYIARGIELLARGDKINTKVDRRSNDGRKIGSPDIRFQIGFYYQNKFGVSDKVNTLRSLMQLSCIPPAARNPDLLQPANKPVDPVAFREFCRKNPQLVRRLRTKVNCARPEEVVQFLRDNARIPTLFKNGEELADRENQFPILPPPFPEAAADEYVTSEVGTTSRPMTDAFDAFNASRAWFAYSLTVVPPPKVEKATGLPLPWMSPRPDEYDAFRYRMPRSPALIIFRQYAPRSQSYLAERLQKEGWFDEGSYWDPDERAGAANRWFPGDREVRLTTKDADAPANSQVEWAKAWQMWNKHGEDNALVLTAGRRERLEFLAGGLPAGLPPDMTPEEMEARGWTAQKLEAMRALAFYDQNRQITNFPFFLESSRAEMDPLTVDARKRLWDADQARLNADNIRAARLYVEALARWREVLRAYPNFHRPERSDQTEEATYEFDLKLIKLLVDDGAVVARARQMAEASRALVPMMPDMARALTGAQGTETRADDFRLAVAEDEAMARIATEAVADVFPNKKNPSESEREVLRRVGQKTDALAGLVGAGVVAADPAAARRAASRAVVDGEFAWMKEFKEPPLVRDASGNYESSAYWVNPNLRESVRSRLGLFRRAPVESAPSEPAPQQ
ncbi:MAG TPA: hypothetical protein VFG68_17045 [Fimbriiglobus sp.]|nr:hypothetical protein [Fimbriiglobus sp.]